eukprot:942186-Rhodomonas_salina.1
MSVFHRLQRNRGEGVDPEIVEGSTFEDEAWARAERVRPPCIALARAWVWRWRWGDGGRGFAVVDAGMEDRDDGDGGDDWEDSEDEVCIPGRGHRRRRHGHRPRPGRNRRRGRASAAGGGPGSAGRDCTWGGAAVAGDGDDVCAVV